MELWALRMDRPLTEDEERTLAARFSPPRRRAESLCAYALLSLVLRERMGWERLPEIVRGRNGKPGFPGFPGVQFNLSHTAGAALAGVSEWPVGVDIEGPRPVPRRLAERFGKTEPAAFFREWTRREAVVKRSGEGIAALSRQMEQPLAVRGLWSVETFPGYAAAACGDPSDPPEAVRLVTMDGLFRLLL